MIKNFVNKNGIVLIGYFLCFVGMIFLIDLFFVPNIIAAENFFSFDSNHYKWIAEKGYAGNKVAFFPLFPKLWMLLRLNLLGVLLFNVMIFMGSFYWLSQKMKFQPIEMLFYLTIPSFCFYYLPYSEALFFGTATILIIGLKEKKIALIIIGLFLSTLTRSAFTILIPAIFITELLTERFDKKTIARVFVYFITIASGILLVAFIQYLDTKRWFEFFEVQKEWNNQLQFLNLPFTSWGGDLILKLDGVAFLFGFSTGILLLFVIFKRIKSNFKALPKELVLSISYLGGMTLYMLLFRGGSLHSLNRYVFSVPFVIVALHYFFKLDYTFSKKEIAIGFVALILFWLLFGSHGHLQTFLKYFILSLYILLVFTIQSKKVLFSRSAAFLLIFLNFFIQVYFYIHFLQGQWVG